MKPRKNHRATTLKHSNKPFSLWRVLRSLSFFKLFLVFLFIFVLSYFTGQQTMKVFNLNPQAMFRAQVDSKILKEKQMKVSAPIPPGVGGGCDQTPGGACYDETIEDSCSTNLVCKAGCKGCGGTGFYCPRECFKSIKGSPNGNFCSDAGACGGCSDFASECILKEPEDSCNNPASKQLKEDCIYGVICDTASNTWVCNNKPPNSGCPGSAPKSMKDDCIYGVACKADNTWGCQDPPPQTSKCAGKEVPGVLFADCMQGVECNESDGTWQCRDLCDDTPPQLNCPWGLIECNPFTGWRCQPPPATPAPAKECISYGSSNLCSSSCKTDYPGYACKSEWCCSPGANPPVGSVSPPPSVQSNCPDTIPGKIYTDCGGNIECDTSNGKWKCKSAAPPAAQQPLPNKGNCTVEIPYSLYSICIGLLECKPNNLWGCISGQVPLPQQPSTNSPSGCTPHDWGRCTTVGGTCCEDWGNSSSCGWNGGAAWGDCQGKCQNIANSSSPYCQSSAPPPPAPAPQEPSCNPEGTNPCTSGGRTCCAGTACVASSDTCEPAGGGAGYPGGSCPWVCATSAQACRNADGSPHGSGGCPAGVCCE